MQPVPESILYNWLSKLNIGVSSTLIKRQMKSHPEYPSLLSITDTLDYLGIENAAVQIEKDQLHEVNTPFLACLRSNGGEFIIAETVNSLEKKFPGFYKDWNGVVVVAEAPPQWYHAQNDEFLKKDKKEHRFNTAGIISFLLITIAAVFEAPGWATAALIITGLAGVFVSWMIVSQDLGIENKLAEKACGAENGCDQVIHSKAAKLPLGIGWSDIGVIWFSSQLIILILASFTGNSAGLFKLLSLAALATIPFTLFSVYYQWRVAQKWCRLCLATVGLLYIQSAILLPRFFQNTWQAIQIKETLFIVAILVMVSLAWLYFKKVLKQSMDREAEAFAGTRFKRKELVVNALSEKQRRADTRPWENDLQLSNSLAPVQVMVACNPYCGPCATTHEKLHEMIAKYGDKIGVTIRFAVNTKNKTDKRTRAFEYILQNIEQATVSMNTKEKAGYTREILHQWFKLMDHEKFVALYPCAQDLDVDGILNRHDEWIRKTNIAFTPTVFINGCELPEVYGTADLEWLISTMINNFPQALSLADKEPGLA